MQFKNFRGGVLLILLGVLVVTGSLLLLTSLPLQLAESILNWQGHDARNFEMVTHSFSERELKIQYLKLKDEAKEIELKNFSLHFNDGQILHLSADLVSFRDLTKPNQSLKSLLEGLTLKDSEPVCINELSLKEARIALSFSADPSVFSAEGHKVCVGPQLSFDNLAIDSKDISLSEHALLWKISHNQFYDLAEKSLIEFPREENKIFLTPKNKESLLRLIK
jgi:hypothetical protein